MSPQTIIFVGRSGCGKGTQAKLVEDLIRQKDSNNRKIFHVETGPNFRKFIKGESHSSKMAQEVHLRDERQPDFLAVWIWGGLFVDGLTGEEHLTIDGAPRSLPEAQILSGALEFYKRRANIIYLNVSRKRAEEMLLGRGREDDKAGRLEKRMDWFEKDVVPAIEYLRNNSKHNFFEINGERPIEEVHADIVAKLGL